MAYEKGRRQSECSPDLQPQVSQRGAGVVNVFEALRGILRRISEQEQDGTP
jgi:hypothetical protein